MGWYQRRVHGEIFPDCHSSKMRSLTALLVIGCVAAGSIRPYSWTPSKEYKYKYSTQVLTGIPELNEQFSGLRLVSYVRVQPKQDYTLRIKLEEPKLITYNDILELDERYLPTEGREEPIPGHMKSWLETPFTIFHKRGIVEKIQVEKSEPEFIVNLKKALVSQLQFDLSEAKLEGAETGRELEPIPTFKVNETTILGECETIYTISKLPEMTTHEYEGEGSVCKGKQHYKILKTKNLESCSIHPVYHESYGVLPKPEGTNSTFLPEQSSFTKTIICGTLEDYYIKNTTTANEIVSSTSGVFENKEKIYTSTSTILELESVERAQREIPVPSSPKGYPSLVFEYTYKTQSSQELEPHMLVPLPDRTSAPTLLRHTRVSQETLKEKLIRTFTEII